LGNALKGRGQLDKALACDEVQALIDRAGKEDH
jgi:hypothetical protein